jgi:polysaccharide biosynthesis/export protein
MLFKTIINNLYKKLVMPSKNRITVFVCMAGFLLYSCAVPKNIAYLQNSSTGNDSLISYTHNGLYEMKIKPKDILSITVTSSSPEATAFYNLILPQITDISSANVPTQTQPTLQTYIVDNDGNIDFPVLGKLSVEGLNRKELESLLQKRLKKSFSGERPIITIRFVNYTVNVLGEVVRPGRYTTQNDRITIFEALAMAGDLTIYGRRDNVRIVREAGDGSKNILQVNLNDKQIIRSPAYYLEQNDVIYVEPNKAKARSSKVGTAESLSISVISVLISLAGIVVTLSK